MSQSLTRLFLHIIFSTKHRRPLIDDIIETQLFEYLGGICKEIGYQTIQVGGYRDHVHILCAQSKRMTVMDALQEIKRSSSKWIKTKGPYSNFYWQDGYGAISVDPMRLDGLEKYIRNQRQHHSAIDYQNECRMIFEENKIAFDERYVWD